MHHANQDSSMSYDLMRQILRMSRDLDLLIVFRGIDFALLIRRIWSF